jgi:hypothetical protein
MADQMPPVEDVLGCWRRPVWRRVHPPSSGHSSG